MQYDDNILQSLATWSIIWCIAFWFMKYRARRLQFGQIFWILPSTWVMIGPVLQIYIPVLLYSFGWNALSNKTDLGGVNEAIAYWTIITFFIALGSVIFEPRTSLLIALKQLDLGDEKRGVKALRIGKAASFLLLLAILARLSQGGISIHEMQVATRVLGESMTTNTRVTMFITPMLALSASLATLRIVIAIKDGHVPMRVNILFWSSLFISSGYQILLGSRGGVLISLAPCVLMITLFLNGYHRRRFLAITALLLVTMMLLSDLSRTITVSILSGSQTTAFSLSGLFDEIFRDNNRNFLQNDTSDGAVVTFFRRIGTGWILSNIIASPESFPTLDVISFLRVYTVAFPSMISPWNEIIPYPTEHGVFDLGYIMGEIITGIEGVGTAVPPQAEIYWRFGWLLGPFAALIWGASIGLLFRFWTRLSSMLGLFMGVFFSLQIGLCETSWVLFANLVRNPILLVLALYASRIKLKRQ